MFLLLQLCHLVGICLRGNWFIVVEMFREKLEVFMCSVAEMLEVDRWWDRFHECVAK